MGEAQRSGVVEFSSGGSKGIESWSRCQVSLDQAPVVLLIIDVSGSVDNHGPVTRVVREGEYLDNEGTTLSESDGVRTSDGIGRATRIDDWDVALSDPETRSDVPSREHGTYEILEPQDIVRIVVHVPSDVLWQF